MSHSAAIRLLALVAITVGLPAFAGNGQVAQTSNDSNPASHQVFSIDGEIGLASLVSLSDGYLQKMADSLQIIALCDAAETGEWELIKEPLAQAAERNVAALNWFAAPDGSYWSVQNGKEAGNLSRRAYFPKVMNGQTIIGELVVSTRTGKPVAIVDVPVRGQQDRVVGILGASVYLDRLSALLEQQMALDESIIFYSFDHTGRVALDWNPDLIFINPKKTGDDELVRALDEMLSKQEGVVSYRFRGKKRTVLFRRSFVTDWWYAFGLIPKAEE